MVIILTTLLIDFIAHSTSTWKQGKAKWIMQNPLWITAVCTYIVFRWWRVCVDEWVKAPLARETPIWHGTVCRPIAISIIIHDSILMNIALNVEMGWAENKTPRSRTTFPIGYLNEGCVDRLSLKEKQLN